MKFSDIPGHEDVKNHLRALVDNDRIPHALLLEGPSGSAKFALARAFANYIHCTDRTPEGDSCGKCPACLQHAKFNHIDTFYSYPVLKKKSGQVTISDDYAPEWRQYLHDSPFMDFDYWLSLLGNTNGQPVIYVDEAAELLRRLNLTARQSKYKIVLLWLPERLQEAAANKLLKLIEEPHSDTLFIMSSDNPRSILPTIYSRTQRISVRRYSDDEISNTLVLKYAVSPDAALSIATLAEGNMSAALRLMDSGKRNQKFLDLFMQLMRLAWLRKVGDLRKWSDEIADLGREGAIRFYDYCSHMVRENFILNIGDWRLNALSKEEMEFSSRFSPFINVVNVETISATLDSARNDMLLNGNAKIIAFDLAVKMILLIKRGQEQ